MSTVEVKVEHPSSTVAHEHVDLNAVGINPQDVKELQKKTRCSKEDVLNELNETFKDHKPLAKEQFFKSFQEHFDLKIDTDRPLLQRIFELADRDKSGTIDFDEYCTVIALLFAESSEEKLRFIFNAMDSNGDGLISREELTSSVTTLWNNELCRHLFDFAIDERRIEGISVFVESFMKEADLNKDGFISFDEYVQLARKKLAPTRHEMKIMPNQTGGHVGNFRKLPGGKIMKATNKIEFDFYAKLNTDYPYLVDYAPTYYGPDRTDDRLWIIIQDLTFNMRKPCVMDVKMGTCSAGEDADAEKRESMVKKDLESTTTQMGIRITGMKVYNNMTQAYTQRTKSWGRDVTEATFTSSLAQYFDNGDRFRHDIVTALQKKLKTFRDWMDTQHNLRFYSSSLLFVYDAAATNLSDEPTEGVVYWSMIDFAHVFPIKDGGKDDGYIVGMRNLMSQFETIQQNSHKL
eukprot:TRINITY_DN3738_c0_g1_i1.p1 TRINITY_DN3738_c0_g1~~TRINITY_DN3738_c0_g1_i1.p1  ORF type:complete len:462 (-),score=136.64 TRINITY_DN3738_c0_g1_i1:48-1433(-)